MSRLLRNLGHIPGVSEILRRTSRFSSHISEIFGRISRRILGIAGTLGISRILGILGCILGIFESDFKEFRPYSWGFRDFTSYFEVFKPYFRDFWSDFTEDFRDCRNFRDFKDFRLYFRGF